MSCQYETGTNFDRVFQANVLQDIEGAYAKALLRKKTHGFDWSRSQAEHVRRYPQRETERLIAGETYVL